MCTDKETQTTGTNQEQNEDVIEEMYAINIVLDIKSIFMSAYLHIRWISDNEN